MPIEKLKEEWSDAVNDTGVALGGSRNHEILDTLEGEIADWWINKILEREKEVRSETYNDIKKIIQDQKLSDEEYLDTSSIFELRKGFETLKKRMIDIIGEV